MALAVPNGFEIKWIDLSKEVPKIDYEKKRGYIRVFTWDGKKYRRLHYREVMIDCEIDGIFYSKQTNQVYRITHWLKISNPPKDKKLEHGICGGELKTKLSPEGIFKCIKCGMSLGKFE